MWALDGMTWEKDEEMPAWPRHFRCRCQKQAIFKSVPGLKIDVSKLELATARPWTIREAGEIGPGGKKILAHGTSSENFSGWYHTLPPADRTAIFGPARAALLDSGLPMRDLIDRGTGRLKRLDELAV